MDAEAEEPARASRGTSGRASGARGGSPARRPPTAKPVPKASAKAAPKTSSAATGASTGTPSPTPKRPTRSTARTGTIGRSAAASAAAEAVVPPPVLDPTAEPAPAVELAPEPAIHLAPDPAEPDRPNEVDLQPAPDFEPAPAPAERQATRVAAPSLAPLGEPSGDLALAIRGLTKRFGGTVAVDGIDLDVPSGRFYGFVGPNGAGKTTTLSMVTGLLRPDAGTVLIDGADVWADPATAKSSLGVLPDRLRLFDRLTGAEFLQHAGALRGLDRETVARRAADLVQAFGLESASRRFVSDFSAGMVKKIAIAAAMIHSPRLLVLDEPFESVDPVSAQLVIDVLKKFAGAGGTVVLSSHSMDLVERVCDDVAIIADGRLLAAGPMAEVLGGVTLETRFVELAGGATAVEGMEWLQSFSD